MPEEKLRHPELGEFIIRQSPGAGLHTIEKEIQFSNFHNAQLVFENTNKIISTGQLELYREISTKSDAVLLNAQKYYQEKFNEDLLNTYRVFSITIYGGNDLNEWELMLEKIGRFENQRNLYERVGGATCRV